MKTYPNQKVVTVKKPKYEKNFITVSISEVEEAFIILTRTELAIYFYLCGNKDGYTFALSPEHIMTQYKISKSSYHRAIERLIELRYLVANGGNQYIFCPSRPTGEYMENNPVSTTEYKENPKMGQEVPLVNTGCPTGEYKVYSQVNTEIDKKNNINKIDNPSTGKEPEEPENEYVKWTREKEQKDRQAAIDIAQQIPNSFNSIKQLREQGRSWEWIRTALEKKSLDVWQNKGLGMLFKGTFPNEIDNELERFYGRIKTTA